MFLSIPWVTDELEVPEGFTGLLSNTKLSVIRQRGESHNRDNNRLKRTKLSEKQTFLTALYVHVRYRPKNTSSSDIIKVVRVRIGLDKVLF